MHVTPAVRAILDTHEGGDPGTTAGLAHILTQGKPGGTGTTAIGGNTFHRPDAEALKLPGRTTAACKDEF